MQCPAAPCDEAQRQAGQRTGGRQRQPKPPALGRCRFSPDKSQWLVTGVQDFRFSSPLSSAFCVELPDVVFARCGSRGGTLRSKRALARPVIAKPLAGPRGLPPRNLQMQARQKAEWRTRWVAQGLPIRKCGRQADRKLARAREVRRRMEKRVSIKQRTTAPAGKQDDEDAETRLCCGHGSRCGGGE